VLYAVVLRGTPGGAIRAIERMRTRRATDNDVEGFFVDSGLQYAGAPADEFTGLDHLEGMSVAILADGAVIPAQTVTGGKVTLAQEASVVSVGLPIKAEIETLPIALETMGGGTGREKNINTVWIRAFSSRGFTAQATAGREYEYRPRTSEAWGAPPALTSGEKKITLGPSWQHDGTITVRNPYPLPLTVTALSLGFAAGGG
jgi:hypothetical protein